MLHHVAPPLLSALLLLSCAPLSDGNSTPVDHPPTSSSPMATPLPQVPSDPLPDAVSTAVKADLADHLGVSVEQLSIGRHSRETWPDGCLGLGGPSEICLAALVEGWQVEVIDMRSQQSYFYRTDLSGQQVRRSELEHNLPLSLRDRIFQVAAAQGSQPSASLEVIDAQPQTWNGCYGLAAANEACPEIAIFGWRAIISDGNQYWIYHTDNLGNEIRLNETASGGTARPSFLAQPDPNALGDETGFQSTIRQGSGTIETFMLEADGRVRYLRQQDGEVIDRAVASVSQEQLKAFWQSLAQANFHHFRGIRYQTTPANPDATLVTLTSRAGSVAYSEASLGGLPPALQDIVQHWTAMTRQLE
ncbi:uncharacterized protein XM38_041770 [Halomicronema hongdechloris C2206]|uniref:Lipoprotein n=1 Tax=Halomicronema hongdechloris C2206 TaxID=1641165 RepID=A0A1Z3HSD9_9CYAN|nr:hypothetical protein [Halomicronema hongdechloris]ASC73215.1 uncharacterized protein XM38_041770 [Halomicronema hongdechloris C2206]